MSDTQYQSLCDQVDEMIEAVLDGTAPEQLYDHLADCDRCRDARHEAARAVALAIDAGADYVPPRDLAERLTAALAGRAAPVAGTDRAEPGAPSNTATEAPAPAAEAPLAPPVVPQKAEETKAEETKAEETKAEETKAEQKPAEKTGEATAAAGKTEPEPAGKTTEVAGEMANDRKAEVEEKTENEDKKAEDEPKGEAAKKAVGATEANAEDEAGDAPEAQAPSAAKPVSLLGRLRRPRNAIIAGVTLAAAAAAVVAAFGPGTTGRSIEAAAQRPWTGKVLKVSRAAGGSGGLMLCAQSAPVDDCRPAEAGAAIEVGTTLRTDDRTRAYVELADGTRLALDRSTDFALVADANRSGKLAAGAVVADVASILGTRAAIGLPRGRIEVIGTKFAVRTIGESAAVDVSRGVVELYDEQGRSVRVRAGEEGRSYPGMAPYASGAAALGEALSWSESQTATDSSLEVRGLGELKARKPGSDEERTGAVTLTRHQVKVRIVDGFARTEVDEVFDNHSDEVLEGIYRFPMPPDAQIERLALEVDGRLEEGAFVDRDRAAAIWRGAIVNASQKRPEPRDEIVWVPGPWRDPALLEWQRGGRFELRIYPIPRQGSRRVILTYTQVLEPSGGVRRYVYPLPHDASGSTRVGDFAVDVQVRGHDRAIGVSSQGYVMARGEQGGADTLALRASSFVPTGDLVIEYAPAGRRAELTAWAYAPADTAGAPPSAVVDPWSDDRRPPSRAPADDGKAATGLDGAPYLAISLRPRLPRRGDDAQRAFAFVVDSSRSMFGERFRRASDLVARVVTELDPLDRFTVLSCDTSCRTLGGGLRAPGRQAASEVSAFLGGIDPEGGTDPAAAIREASALGGHVEGRELRLVYIGDGTPTVGPIRPGFIADAVRDALPPGRGTLTTVAIGSDADRDALDAMARGGNGLVVPYTPGSRTAEVAYAILAASYGSGLSQATVELPAGLVEVAPARLPTVSPGGEVIVVARMTEPSVRGSVVLRGKVGDTDFEQRYPLDAVATSDKGNAFVPRLYAAVRIADLQRDGSASARERAVALSQRFNVASRYTSLLVLESEAMFRAFGLDNTRHAPVWTGEDDTRATARADGELEVAPDAPEELAGIGGDFDERKGDDSGLARKMRASAGPPAAEYPAGGTYASPPPTATAAPPVTAKPAAPARPKVVPDDLPDDRWRGGRRMIPMRRVWERTATILPGLRVPLVAGTDKVAAAESELAQNDNRRGSVKKLYTLYALSGDLGRAEDLVERWSRKEALDPEALTARADLAARAGQREQAIRILGSVVDVRPGDVPSQQRLARLHRWAGAPALGCRHSMAIAQLRQKDVELLVEAVGCARQSGEQRLAQGMLEAADEATRTRAEQLLERRREEVAGLRGELQLSATWDGGADLDLALIHPDGHRVSWLGAPTREPISATDVTSRSREALGLLGSKAGEYVIEIVRASGEGSARGELVVRAAGTTRTIPFTLDGTRVTLGTVQMGWQSRLVPM